MESFSKAVTATAIKCPHTITPGVNYCPQHTVEKDLINFMEKGMATTFPKGCPHANKPGEYCYPCMRSEFG